MRDSFSCALLDYYLHLPEYLKAFVWTFLIFGTGFAINGLGSGSGGTSNGFFFGISGVPLISNFYGTIFRKIATQHSTQSYVKKPIIMT